MKTGWEARLFVGVVAPIAVINAEPVPQRNVMSIVAPSLAIPPFAGVNKSHVPLVGVCKATYPWLIADCIERTTVSERLTISFFISFGVFNFCGWIPFVSSGLRQAL